MKNYNKTGNNKITGRSQDSRTKEISEVTDKILSQFSKFLLLTQQTKYLNCLQDIPDMMSNLQPDDKIPE